jgi:hypothetical protein
MLLLVLACQSTSPSTSPDEKDLGPPSIVAASYSCDSPSARWSFLVDTDAWTGNGQVVLSDDGDYIEVHPLRSLEAAADGSSDRLTLALGVVADWRDVSLGSTTAFNCSEPGLAGLIRIFATDGQTPTDCRIFGEDRWASWNFNYSCTTPLEKDSGAE